MANFVKVGQTFFRKDDSGQLYAVSDKDTMNALKQQSIPYEVAENTRGLSFGTPSPSSAGKPSSENRSLDFAMTGTSNPATTSLTSTEDPTDEIETLLKARLVSALQNYGGSSNADELEVKRQEILRKQLLSAPYSEEGEESLTGAQKLALMRDQGTEYEPLLKSLEDEIAAARAGGADSVDSIAKIAQIAESLGMIGGGGFESASGKEYSDYVRTETAAGRTPMSFNEYLDMDANRKRQTTVITPYQESSLLNGIINKYNADPVIGAANRAFVLKDSIKSIRDNPTNGAQQLNLIYSYIKGLDTDSAVREGEISLVNQIVSYSGQLENALAKINSGRPLDEKTALEISNAGAQLVNTINEAAQRKEQQYQSQARVQGLESQWNDYIGGFTSTYSEPMNPDAKQPGESDSAYSMRISKKNNITQSLAPTADGQIYVIQNADGQIGTIPPGEYDPAVYTKM